MSFNNKVVIVTGASSGIGAATARMFAEQGAAVALVARRRDKLEALADQIQHTAQKPLIIQADVSKDVDANAVISKTIDHFGKLDILINNAGIAVQGSILSGKVVEAYDEVMKTNVRAVMQLTTLAAPFLVKTKGNIVNVSSAAAMATTKNPITLPYYVSKAALDHFTRCAARELAASGIRVNTVNPGPVDNEFSTSNRLNDDASSTGAYKNALRGLTALGNIATDDEIGELILFLASEKARSVTGSSYLIDNGILLNH